MPQKHKQFLTIFRKLNTKIIVYFLSFSFLPLLMFSLLGYYLNKNLIDEININHLSSINNSYSNQIANQLSHKKHLIGQILQSYENSEKTISLQHYMNNNQHLKLEFSHLEVINQDDSEINFQNVNKTIAIDSLLALHYKNNYSVILGYFSTEEMGNLLESDVKEIQNIAYFLISGKKVTSNAAESLNEHEVKQIQSIKMGASTSIDGTSENRTGFLSISSYLKEFDILIETRINTASFYVELNKFRNKILLANLIFALILATLAIIFSRRITTPIDTLIQATQEIGQGNLETKIEVNSDDEVQILASEFELMRHKLQESYQGMEEKIQKRTRELQEAQAQISHQEKMASLGMMAAGIAHEIGNPLTSISSMAQVIKRKTNDLNINEYVTNILKNIDRISRIVRELVDFSRPSSYEEAPVNVNDIIQSAVGIIRYDRRSKNIKYDLILESELPETVLVSDHVLQIFLNILINAVDATEGHGSNISVKSSSQNGNIFVKITDSGVGIPADMKNKIFE
ncbi:MAG: sensor histidine kinase, partial [Promethearchaeota archaeon]